MDGGWLVLGWGGGKLWSVTWEEVRGDESRRLSSEEGRRLCWAQSQGKTMHATVILEMTVSGSQEGKQDNERVSA